MLEPVTSSSCPVSGAGARVGTAPVGDRPLAPKPKGSLLRVISRLWEHPLRVSTAMTREYGDIVRLDLGLSKIFFVSDPECAQYVLRDHAANFTKEGGMWNALRLIDGDGLGVSEGPVWLRQRRMMQPLFHRQRLAKLTPYMTAAITECLPAWYDAASRDTPFDLAHAMERVTMRVILKTICSASIGDAEIEEMSHAVAQAFRYIWLRMWTYFCPEWLPLPGKRDFHKALASIDRIIYGIVNQRRQNPDQADDLLSLLFAARDDDGHGMSDRQIRDEVVGFYVAGFETSATALAWALYLLCENPDAEAKARREIDEVLQGRTPDHADLGQLAYTRMAFQEAMRLYPPAWILPRRALQDDQLGGYHIPKDSIIALHFYALQRNPKVWSEPEAFKPERFASDGGKASQRCAYVPFGTGARQCIGSNFALMEGPLVLAMLLQRFRFELWPGHTVELDKTIALRSRNGIPVRLTAIPQTSPQTSSR